MSDVVEIRGLRLLAIVGVLTEEREREQPLMLDIDFARPFGEAAAEDTLAATTNYADVLDTVQRVVREGHYLLLETLVSRVARAILDHDTGIEWTWVRVHKLRPPVSQDVTSLGVSCRLHRNP